MSGGWRWGQIRVGQDLWWVLNLTLYVSIYLGLRHKKQLKTNALQLAAEHFQLSYVEIIFHKGAAFSSGLLDSQEALTINILTGTTSTLFVQRHCKTGQSRGRKMASLFLSWGRGGGGGKPPTTILVGIASVKFHQYSAT